MGKGALTKELIITKSAELFNTVGYEATSLLHIMEATGLKKGGIYNHFQNKDEIAFASFEYSFQLVLSRFRKKLDGCETSKEKLFAIIDVFVGFAEKPVVKGGCPIFNTAIDAVDLHPRLHQKAKDAVNTLLKYVEIKIEEGKIEGEFKPGINAEDFSLMLVSSLEGALMVARVNQNTGKTEQVARLLKAYIESNILK